ncbi:rCG63485 [Rattus norvegicus]|uniref:RCG63485 n=1 Tax=Rattus norvegicus TaxID=10116 RepID=A6HGH6_RAT|nr:rCG63485 [Rattus norvegicus]
MLHENLGKQFWADMVALLHKTFELWLPPPPAPGSPGISLCPRGSELEARAPVITSVFQDLE